MTNDLEDLLQRCSAAQQSARSLVARHVQLLVTRHRLRRYGVEVLQDFASLAHDFYTSVSKREERKR